MTKPCTIHELKSNFDVSTVVGYNLLRERRYEELGVLTSAAIVFMLGKRRRIPLKIDETQKAH